ncbi:helix-turn-helix transcriptional regulator [Actinopolymorpha singaporensis]|uniref:helix-turn-helix transcriptional regulator n=1 Tax=Actinopolymorpha singaporensis TaxID=117157 RepID=UPI000B817F6C|nr:LuxR C-terminal-related transcriptional regulator [Actinopolymorpha singaporensis]
MPVPTVPVLPRPRLFAALTAAVEHRVTVVNASAGTGKTMLLASWLRWSANQRAAWVSFDRGDNEPKFFWAYVVESLRRACGAEDAALLADLGAADLGGEEFPRRFLDAVGRLREPVVLIVDQAHEITDWRLLAGLETVLQHGPAGLRLVLAGRGQPALPLARLRVAGELADLGSADLAYTREEAVDLLAAYGVQADDAQATQVWRRTEGWTAGLRLAALWWQTQPAAGRDLTGFTGDQPLVAGYLDDELMRPQPPLAREFLLATCLVEPVCGDLADAMTGERDGALTLEALDRDNALVNGVGSGRVWFRYAPLLREFLAYRLGRERPGQEPELRCRAARWYAGAGMVAGAVRCAVAARDWVLAGEVLGRDGSRVFANGEGAELEPLLASVPAEAVAAHADLAAACAHVRLNAGDADGAEALLRLAEEARPADGADELQAFVRLLRTAQLRLRQTCLRGRVTRPDVARGRELLDRARTAGVAADRQAEVGALAYWVGVAELWRGALPEAKEAFAQALGRLTTGGLRRWEGHARDWLALLNALEGRLAAAEQVLRAGVDRGGEAPSAPQIRPAGADAGPSGERAREARTGSPLVRDLARAAIELERDRLDQAWVLLEHHRHEGTRIGAADTPGPTRERDDTNRADPADPADPAVPVDPAVPADPGDPAQRIDSTGVVAAADPADPPLGDLLGVLRARALLYRGDLGSARTELAATRDAAGRLHPVVDQAATLLEAEISTHEGATERATELLAGLRRDPGPARDISAGDTSAGDTSAGDTSAGGAAAGPPPAVLVAEGRTLLAAGDPAGALTAVAPCLDADRAPARPLDTVAALLVAATAQRRLGEQAPAGEYLERALALAERDYLVRVFLDAGRGVRALLTVVVAPEGRHAAFRSALLHRFDVAPAAGWKARSTEQAIRLTASERAVLRYLPSHLTNEEIAQDLCLSVNTVKSHLRTLYRKLGVTSRREAIARALQIDLLR